MKRGLFSLHRAPRTTAFCGIVLFVLLPLVVAGCGNPFDIDVFLDGPDGTPLSISPSSTVVQAGEELQVVASGGVPPYRYSVESGGGSFADDVYTAPDFSGAARIRVVDAVDTVVEADYTTYAVDTGNLGLAISPATITVFRNQAVQFVPIGGDGPFNFELTVNNSASPTATANGVTSYAYMAGPVLGTDTITLTDTFDSLTVTAIVTVVDTATNVDYSPSAIVVSSAGPYMTGGAFSADFSFTNNGSAPGSKDVIWRVFASPDPTIGGSDDTIAASGTIAGGTAAGSVTPVAVGGTWPSVAGSYWLLVDLAAADDVATGDNQNSSASTTAVTGPDIEYTVASISSSDLTPDAGAAIVESFTLHNDGVDAGSDALNWYVYLSTDNALDGGDTLFDAGTVVGGLAGDDAGPGGPDETTIGVSGNWPAAPGPWYLIVKESSSDEGVTDEWVASAEFSVQDVSVDVDYFLSTLPSGGSFQVGDPIAESFVATNQGADAGSAAINWFVYLSSDVTYNAGDTLIDAGSYPGGLGAGANTGGIAVDGDLIGAVWPSTGSWYLIVRLAAADEANTSNNISPSTASYFVSDPAPVNPEYVVTNISAYSAYVTTGSTVSETFAVTNIGSDGSADVNWTAYASTDTIPNGGEEIGTGVIPGGLTAGTTLANITAFGTWPASAGSYYLIVEENAADESVTDDYAVSAEPFVVSDPPDYSINTVTYPMAMEAGTAITGDFTIDNGGSGNGTKNVLWEVFLSFDPGFSVDDQLLGSGVIGALPAGGDAVITAADLTQPTWPGYGLSHILIRVTAADDAAVGDNEHITASLEIYVLDRETADTSGTSNDGEGSSSGPIPDTQYLGSLQVGQTLVVRGWLDDSSPGDDHDTYSFDVGTGVDSVGTFATWSTGSNSAELYVWDELNNEFSVADNVPDREPASGALTITGWVSPETGYASIRSYEFVAPAADGPPYTLYIIGGD